MVFINRKLTIKDFKAFRVDKRSSSIFLNLLSTEVAAEYEIKRR